MKKEGIFIGNAFKLGTELVAAVVVGTIIGFILDNWFDTKPILIIIFFLFGAAAGIVNVFRAAKKMQKGINLWPQIQCINLKCIKLDPNRNFWYRFIIYKFKLFMAISALLIAIIINCLEQEKKE